MSDAAGASISHADTPLDGDGRLRAELPCVGCGYVLRGLRPGDNCPECGAAVAESIVEHPLAAADPAWRRRLRRGLLVLVAVLGLEAVHAVLSPLASLFFAYTLAPTSFGLMAMVSSWVARFFWLIVCAAVWWATPAEPGPAADHGESLRRASRRLVFLSVIAGAVSWGAAVALRGLGGIGWVSALPHAPRIAANAALTLALLLLLRYFARLARRLPAEPMRRTVTWGLALGGCALAASVIGGTMQTTLLVFWFPSRGGISPPVSNAWLLAAITTGVGMLLGVAFAACQIVFYLRLRRQIPPPGRSGG